MRFTKKLNYNLKRILPIGLIAAAGMMSSCSDKDEPEIPQHDVELTFDAVHYDNIGLPIIKELVVDPKIRYIYLCPEGNFLNFDEEGVAYMYKWMKTRVNIAPDKVRGRGNFIFSPGLVTQPDSLWFVNHGWTVNQHQK